MIPVKLAVRNFMPYRDNVPPLHFSGIHTVSIWGENGNGKSALIDAMTWALWGKTRARRDDDLIHQGQTETEVEFEFAVGQQTYRIIRKHAKPKRRQASGQTILEFQIARNGSFRSISGNSIQQTQQEITRVLHMDYLTFINSALLLQGRADEFTIANPARRKQVLADILGLSQYDELEEQAKELAKQRGMEKTIAEGVIRDISEELGRKPAYEAELAQAQSELSAIEKTISRQEARLNELRQQRELLKLKQLQLKQLEEQVATAARTLEHWNNQVRQHHSRIKEYEELIARRATIEEGYAQFIAAKKLSEELNQKLRLATALNERKHRLEMVIVQASQALLSEHALAENKISELEAGSRRLPWLKNELLRAQAESARLVEEEAVLSQKRQASQQLRGDVRELESAEARLEQEIVEITGKLHLLLTESGAKCPLCETVLGAAELKLIETKYAKDKQDKSSSLRAKQGGLAQKKAELDSIESEMPRLEARLNQSRNAAQGQANLLSQEIARIEEADKQLAGEKAKKAEIEERLARKDFARNEQEAISQVEAELARLDYDARQQDEVNQRLSRLERYEDPKRRLEEADRLIKQERETLSGAEQAAWELRQRLEADEQKGQELTAELSSLPRLVDELEQAEAEHRALSSQQKQAQERVGTAKGRLERCAELEITRQEKEKLVSRAGKEENIYRELAQAFGKTGVQAFLIEMTLPEIEAEANKLLGRMTDNRMHVKIETQRETKQGDLRETLDITIADELGTRSYEMFSGGEAFRINFAIRIALSRLLARRAGAPLPTLIIDEGFGTQDSAGLEKLKEAITSIQDDFEKIIVITHIEELRDAFPARIDVIKTAAGSTIEVS